MPIRDSALGWWSPDTVGPGNSNPAIGGDAAGVYMYLDGGKRYVAGKFPKNKTGFFDKSLSSTIYKYDQVPASEPQVTAYPCTSCPSSGSATPAPASSA